MRQGRSRYRSHQTKKKEAGFWHQTTDRKKSNRFLGQDQASAKRQFKIVMWSALSVLMLTGICWLLFFSEQLQIRTIEITGNRNINQDEVRKLVEQQLEGSYLYIIPKTSLLLFSVSRLNQSLNDNFQLIAAEISRNPLKQKLIINLLEKDYNYIWQEGSTYYYINREGDVIMTKQAPTKDYLVVENTGPTLFHGRKVNVDPKYLDYAKEIDAALRNNNRGLNLRTFVYDGTINVLRVNLTSGPSLIFNTETPVQLQLNKLDVLRSNLLRDGHEFNQLNYINLRVGDRVFYQ